MILIGRDVTPLCNVGHVWILYPQWLCNSSRFSGIRVAFVIVVDDVNED